MVKISGLNLAFLCEAEGKKWVKIGFELGLFFRGIVIISSKSAKIGFEWLCRKAPRQAEIRLNCTSVPSAIFHVSVL